MQITASGIFPGLPKSTLEPAGEIRWNTSQPILWVWALNLQGSRIHFNVESLPCTKYEPWSADDRQGFSILDWLSRRRERNCA
jgi:hypothetical protein